MDSCLDVATPWHGPKKRARKCCPGPAELDGVLSLNSENVHRVWNSGFEQAKQQMRLLAENGMVITSTYSGTGVYEGALREIFCEIQSATGSFTGTLTSYSSCEILPAARWLLQHHPQESQPLHSFVDVLDRLYDTDRGKLEQMETCMLVAYNYLKDEKLLGAISKEVFVRERQVMGAKYLHDLKVIFCCE